jgi:tetratricopeptide (TPR) repeat protein
MEVMASAFTYIAPLLLTTTIGIIGIVLSLGTTLKNRKIRLVVGLLSILLFVTTILIGWIVCWQNYQQKRQQEKETHYRGLIPVDIQNVLISDPEVIDKELRSLTNVENDRKERAKLYWMDALHGDSAPLERRIELAQFSLNIIETGSAHLLLGLFLADSQPSKLDKAFDEFKRAAKYDAVKANAHFNLGVVFDRLGKGEKAEREYRRVLQLMPNFPEAHFNLGLALTNQGKDSEGEKEYREAVRLKPRYAEAHTNLGSALMRRGQRDEGEKEYRLALLWNPNLSEAHGNLGILY